MSNPCSSHLGTLARKRVSGDKAGVSWRNLVRVLAAPALLLGSGREGAAQSTYTPYNFTTLAGSYGGQDGPGPTVRLSGPFGVVVAPDENVYFTDTSFRVMKVSPAGMVSTVAGSAGVEGNVDGPSVLAEFTNLRGIARDAGGNLYVTDATVIRKISASGIVSTLAGQQGVVGNADGTGGNATFFAPLGIAVDGAQNAYVADSYGEVIRKISAAGQVTTLAGSAGSAGSADGLGADARFFYPTGIVVDGGGNLYVSDNLNFTIRKITPAGEVTTLAGSAGSTGYVDGTGSAARFMGPQYLALGSDGTLYVGDEGRIRTVTAAGVVGTLFGGFVQGSLVAGGAIQGIYAFGLTVDGSGSLFLADYPSRVIWKIPPGGVPAAIAGNSGGSGDVDGLGAGARFNSPWGAAVDAHGNAYVADTGNNLIRKISAGGAVTTIAGTAGPGGSVDGTGPAARFSEPAGVALDGSGNLYVADMGNCTIRMISPAGAVTTVAGTAGSLGIADGTGAAAMFNEPEGVAVDALSGNVYVADTDNCTIRRISPGGVVTTLAGTPNTYDTRDGTGPGAHFIAPSGIAVDGSGSLYVTDGTRIGPGLDSTHGNTIRKVTPAGVVTTIVGTAGVEGSADGQGVASQFLNPTGVASDGAGDLYIADSGNNTVRRISATGVVTTLAGVPGAAGGADGTGAGARFNDPAGIALDGSGNVYVADSRNNTLRVGVGAQATPSLPSEPTLSLQPPILSVSSNGTVVFGGPPATAPSASYQWFFDGSPIAGAILPTLVVNDTTISAQGYYDRVATNTLGVTTNSETLSVVSTADPGRLINLSCRSSVGTGPNVLIAGFVVGGGGTSGAESLLVRASGPALVPFGVTGALPDPELELSSTGTGGVIATNSGWGGNALISGTANAVGAFAWANAASLDSALVEPLAGGAYTALVSGATGDSGIALAEIYDATPAGTYSASIPRLINISARTQVGQGANVLIAGFVIGGTTSKTVLIRASGPALVPFGVSGVLPDPQLQLNDAGGVIAANSGWGGDPQIASSAASVGAFSWGVSATADSAVLVTLPPGAYTAQVSGASGDSGIALVEVYEVP